MPQSHYNCIIRVHVNIAVNIAVYLTVFMFIISKAVIIVSQCGTSIFLMPVYFTLVTKASFTSIEETNKLANKNQHTFANIQ